MFSLELLDEVNARRGVLNIANRRCVVDNLIFVYHMIVASGTMLDVAAAKAPPCKFRDFLVEHASEEREHAHWLHFDLAVCDASIHNPELLFDASSIAGMQYYLALHVTPYCLLGYMLVLECFPMSEASVNQLENLHGPALFNTLRYHSTHDVEHGAEVLRQIDNMPIVYRELVRQNALRTVGAIANASRRFGSFPAVAAHGAAEGIV